MIQQIWEWKDKNGDLYKRTNVFVHSVSLFIRWEADPQLTGVQQGREVLQARNVYDNVIRCEAPPPNLNIFLHLVGGQTAKFKDCRYFRLYSRFAITSTVNTDYCISHQLTVQMWKTLLKYTFRSKSWELYFGIPIAQIDSRKNFNVVSLFLKVGFNFISSSLKREGGNFNCDFWF